MLLNIGGKENGTSIDILCGNEIVGHSDKFKLLSVTIDNQLNFSENISQLCQKASRQVGVLMRMKKLVPERAKLVFYRSSILPHLTYCQKIWHFARASDKRKLERMQEKALRAVFLNKTSTYEQLLVKAHLPSLNNRRLEDILILMYKVKDSKAPSFLCDLFSLSNKKYNLRNSDFDLPRFKTVRFGKQSITYLGPHLWAKLSKKN